MDDPKLWEELNAKGRIHKKNFLRKLQKPNKLMFVLESFSSLV